MKNWSMRLYSYVVGLNSFRRITFNGKNNKNLHCGNISSTKIAESFTKQITELKNHHKNYRLVLVLKIQ